MGRRAVVIGGSGLIGNELVHQLLEDEQYETVVTIGRKQLPLEHPKLEQRVIDMNRLEQELDPSVLQHAAVFCTLGTTIKKAGSQEAFRKVDFDYPLALAKLAAESDASHFLIVTALGSNANARNFYSRVKGELEVELKTLPLRQTHIFQPSLLLGDRNEFRFGEQAATVIMKLLKPIMIGGLRPYRAVHARDVAAAMIKESHGRRAGHYVHPSSQLQPINHSL